MILESHQFTGDKHEPVRNEIRTFIISLVGIGFILSSGTVKRGIRGDDQKLRGANHICSRVRGESSELVDVGVQKGLRANIDRKSCIVGPLNKLRKL
jgi:hypothetical protein